MRNHALKNESVLSHLIEWTNAQINTFYDICHSWMSQQVAHPDEENWWAVWYPEYFRLAA
ncbi:hypothetical protein D2E25_0342 [Bifidobacterium goeldii]|uniref:Uncharacterized protein n=1 Tax=Bifidobacterium goeldii TaxID=2306975 RepID=A0A430FME1_9BIFI|nr:hypothetical protein [Bifidobacterium goeldii]RSX54036.1 hypothetical protein D2E25_0342 [Bifidobacterium goeldii]